MQFFFFFLVSFFTLFSGVAGLICIFGISTKERRDHENSVISCPYNFLAYVSDLGLIGVVGSEKKSVLGPIIISGSRPFLPPFLLQHSITIHQCDLINFLVTRKKKRVFIINIIVDNRYVPQPLSYLQ